VQRLATIARGHAVCTTHIPNVQPGSAGKLIPDDGGEPA